MRNRPWKIHELKIWPKYFLPVLHGFKSAEYRKDDRDFQEDDVLHLKEFTEGRYTGNEMFAVIRHIDRGDLIPEGYALLSITPASRNFVPELPQ